MLVTTHDIYVDGVGFSIDYDVWDVGMSIFIPCLTHTRVLKQVRRQMARRNMTMVHESRVENQLLGIRFWRTT